MYDIYMESVRCSSTSSNGYTCSKRDFERLAPKTRKSDDTFSAWKRLSWCCVRERRYCVQRSYPLVTNHLQRRWEYQPKRDTPAKLPLRTWRTKRFQKCFKPQTMQSGLYLNWRWRLCRYYGCTRSTSHWSINFIVIQLCTEDATTRSLVRLPFKKGKVCSLVLWSYRLLIDHVHQQKRIHVRAHSSAFA